MRYAAAAAVVAIASLMPGLPAAPTFPIPLQDPSTGRDVELATGARALHIVFFATWCQPCRQEIEQLRDLEARWEERGYRLVIVAVRNRQSPERVARFIEEGRPPGEVLFDATGRAERSLAAEYLPTHLLLDRGGSEILRAERIDDGLEEAIERLLL